MTAIRALCLTFVATSAMACISVSAASAEIAFCATDQTLCSSPISHIHLVTSGKMKLKSSLPTIECTGLYLGDVLKNGSGVALSNPLIVHGTLTYSSCNNFCSLVEEGGGLKTLSGNADSRLLIITYQNLVNVNCPFINCNYTSEGLEGHFLDALTSTLANGSAVITEQGIEKESGSCPEEAFLTTTTTPLSATYSAL